MNIGDVKLSKTATASGRRARIKKKQYMAASPASERSACKRKQDVRTEVRLCGPKRTGSKKVRVRTLRKKTTVSMERWPDKTFTRDPITAKAAEEPRTKRAPATGWFRGTAPGIIFSAAKLESPFKRLILEPISKIVDHAQKQGAGRQKSAAYMAICEHFEEVGNIAFER